MPTYKILVLPHQKRKDGTYNVKIRITHNKKSKYFATPFYAGKDDLTRTLKIKNRQYLDACEDRIRIFRRRCDSVGLALADMSADDVLRLATTDAADTWDLDFVTFAREYPKCQKRVQTMSRWLQRFVDAESVSVKLFTRDFVRRWAAYVTDNRNAHGGRGGATTVRSVIEAARIVYNRARMVYNDEERGLVRLPFDPFRGVELPKVAPPRKRAVSIATIRAIAALPDSGRTSRDAAQRHSSVRDLARDMFCLSLALCGTNAADLYELRPEDYRDGRITYKRRKTRGSRADEALISIAVQPEAARIIEKYRARHGDWLLNLHNRYNTAAGFNRALFDGMNHISRALGEKVTFYSARHSWATIAVNDAGVDKYTVHEGLNHASGVLSITDVYIRKSWERIDAANRAVLDLVNFEE